MAKIVEGNPSGILNKWPLLLDEDSIKPIVAGYVLAKRKGKWIPGKFWFGNKPWDSSLFWNGVFFFRVMLPFWIGIGIRWSATYSPSYFQCGFGWKGNGRFAILFRFQTDESAAKGMSGPNYGQTIGFKEGTK